jgi:hypothetical protein
VYVAPPNVHLRQHVTTYICPIDSHSRGHILALPNGTFAAAQLQECAAIIMSIFHQFQVSLVSGPGACIFVPWTTILMSISENVQMSTELNELGRLSVRLRGAMVMRSPHGGSPHYYSSIQDYYNSRGGSPTCTYWHVSIWGFPSSLQNYGIESNESNHSIAVSIDIVRGQQ